MTRTSLQKCIT